MEINPNAGLYDAWAGLNKKVETGREKGRYQQWYQEMIDYAQNAQIRGAAWNALSMFNPGIGIAARAIDTAYTSANMPEQFELDPDLIYSDPNVVSDYASGSQEAIYELENSLWSGLTNQIGSAFQVYGSPWDEGDYQWGTQFKGREGSII